MATSTSHCTLSTMLKCFSSASRPKSPHAGIALQADPVKPSKSRFPINLFSCLAFLRRCVGYLHISVVPPHPHLPIVLSRPRHLRYSYLSTRPHNPTTVLEPTLVPDFRYTALLDARTECQSRSFLARILCGELGFECFHMCPHSVQVHKFSLYFVAVTQCPLQAECLLGIVRGNVTNKQFWDAGGELGQISIPAHLRRRRRGPCCQGGGQEMSQLPVNRNLSPSPPSSTPSSATLIPHIYFKLSLHTHSQ